MRKLVWFAVIWVVSSLVLEWIVSLLAPHFYFFTAALQATDGQTAADFIFYVVTPIFDFVVLMIFFGIFGFRARPGDTSASPSQVRSNKAYISIWIAVSLLVNLFLFVHPTASALQEYFNQGVAYTHDPNALVVDVTARQWEWSFSYPQYRIAKAVNQNGEDELVLPVNRPVVFVLRSYDFNHWYDEEADVIHSFWVPAFGIKMDVVPGETRYEYVDPTVISNYNANPMMRVQCAEVCGPGHPFMEANVYVESASDFAAWVKGQQKAGN